MRILFTISLLLFVLSGPSGRSSAFGSRPARPSLQGILVHLHDIRSAERLQTAVRAAGLLRYCGERLWSAPGKILVRALGVGVHAVGDNDVNAAPLAQFCCPAQNTALLRGAPGCKQLAGAGQLRPGCSSRPQGCLVSGTASRFVAQCRTFSDPSICQNLCGPLFSKSAVMRVDPKPGGAVSSRTIPGGLFSGAPQQSKRKDKVFHLSFLLPFLSNLSGLISSCSWRHRPQASLCSHNCRSGIPGHLR